MVIWPGRGGYGVLICYISEYRGFPANINSAAAAVVVCVWTSDITTSTHTRLCCVNRLYIIIIILRSDSSDYIAMIWRWRRFSFNFAAEKNQKKQNNLNYNTTTKPYWKMKIFLISIFCYRSFFKIMDTFKSDINLFLEFLDYNKIFCVFEVKNYKY